MSYKSDYCPSDEDCNNIGDVDSPLCTTSDHPPPNAVSSSKSTRQTTRLSLVPSRASQDLNLYIDSAIWDREKDHKDQFNICPCTSFGIDRERHFPHYFFCGECSQWDTDALAGALSKKKSTSRRYKCTAKHKVGLLSPSDVQKYHHTLFQTGKLSTASTEEIAEADPNSQPDSLCQPDNPSNLQNTTRQATSDSAAAQDSRKRKSEMAMEEKQHELNDKSSCASQSSCSIMENV